MTRSPEISSELERDARLVEDGWSIEWVFEGKVSQPLLDDLNAANIQYKLLNQDTQQGTN